MRGMFVATLAPTAYHEAVQQALRRLEPGLWAWYASDAFGEDYAQRMRLELLKATYRLERDSYTDVYDCADEVAGRLGVQVPITLYQGGDRGGMNACLCFVPEAVHLVLSGPVLSVLQRDELRALLGHEFAHHVLWSADGGSYRAADALVEAVACHASAPSSWIQLAGRQRRYTEIYADRGALIASEGDLSSVVRCLLKVSAGIEAPDATAYLRQVDEVMRGSPEGSEGESHPELFLRVWAMQQWLEQGSQADAGLAPRVEGPRTLETLDLLAQVQLSELTRELVCHFLRLPGLRSELMLAHARQFFPELSFEPESTLPGQAMTLPLTSQDDPQGSVADYFGYVLLDLCTADHELEDVALAAALACADEARFGASFEKLARKELRLTVAGLSSLRQRWPAMQAQLVQAQVGAS